MTQHTDMFVYALRDPREADIKAMRYIGVCDDTEARLRRHLLSARNGSGRRVHVWMRELGEMPPLVMALGTVTRDLAASAERIAIGFWRAAGADLLNDTDGGEGFLTTEQRERMGVGVAAGMRAAWQDPAKRSRMLKAVRKNWAKASAASRAASRAALRDFLAQRSLLYC